MRLLIRRSTLILPATVPRFVERAHLRGADAIMLDPEDAVPPEEKDDARRLIAEAGSPSRRSYSSPSKEASCTFWW